MLVFQKARSLRSVPARFRSIFFALLVNSDRCSLHFFSQHFLISLAQFNLSSALTILSTTRLQTISFFSSARTVQIQTFQALTSWPVLLRNKSRFVISNPTSAFLPLTLFPIPFSLHAFHARLQILVTNFPIVTLCANSSFAWSRVPVTQAFHR